MPLTYTDAVRELLEEFAWNTWFIDTFWPENAPRIRLMVDISKQASKASKQAKQASKQSKQASKAM